MQLTMPFCPVASVAISAMALVWVGDVRADPEADKYATKRADGEVRFEAKWANWQKDIAHFDVMLGELVDKADIPKEKEFKERLESASGWIGRAWPVAVARLSMLVIIAINLTPARACGLKTRRPEDGK